MAGIWNRLLRGQQGVRWMEARKMEGKRKRTGKSVFMHRDAKSGGSRGADQIGQIFRHQESRTRFVTQGWSRVWTMLCNAH